MSKPELLQAFNDQIREELNSYYVYMALSADMDFLSLTGAAAWFRKQADEERGHAQNAVQALISGVARPSTFSVNQDGNRIDLAFGCH